VFYSKGDISVQTEIQTMEVPVAAYGKVDERAIDVMAVISFEPAGEWESLGILWPYGAFTVGASIFDGASYGESSGDIPLTIQSVDGKLYTFPAAALTKIPTIRGSASETMIGAVEFTAIRKDNTAWSTADSLFTIASNAWSDTGFDPAAILTQPLAAAWGSSPWDDIETQTGWTIDFDLQTSPVPMDDIGTYDMKFASTGAMAKCIPANIPEANINTALLVQDTGAARGRSLNANSNDLALTATGVVITLKAAQLKSAGFQFGNVTLRQGEIGLIATRGFTAGAPDPFYTVAAS